MLSLLLSSILACGSNANAATENEITLHGANDLIAFSNNVNEGTDYNGTTVLLDSDIDFTGFHNFNSIGNNYTNYFVGTFDGQGHVISNLKIEESSYYYTGLFGYSKGMTIQNVILDSTCTIESSAPNRKKFVGSMIGSCFATKRECNILNSVNMASVTINVGTKPYNSVYLGGIVGIFGYDNHRATVKNCANYGMITQDASNDYSFVGGIAGYIDNVDFMNCLNYGSIVHNGNISYTGYIGGIIGYCNYMEVFIGCVSAGNIDINKITEYLNVGAISGYFRYETDIYYCYWSDEIEFDPYQGTPVPSSSTSVFTSFNDEFVLNESVSVGEYNGTSLIDALNAATEYYSLKDLSKWILNKNNEYEGEGENSITFTINDNKPFTIDSPLILLPILTNNGMKWFDGWYTDKDCTHLLTDFANVTTTELYSIFDENANKTFTVTFNTRGGSPVDPFTAPFGSAVEFPVVTKENYMILHWEDLSQSIVTWNYVMPAHNITLYAVWAPVHISTPEGLIELSDIVNSGMFNYSDVTVYLDSDIEFTDELSKRFKPIGIDNIFDYKYFGGTFDGQGHSIKNLVLSAVNYAGLFGYSFGMTLRNLVIDESCSYDKVFASGCTYDKFSSFVGLCYASYAPCIIENCVNRMDVNYTGFINRPIIGGIIGNAYSEYYSVYIRNCTNYGNVLINEKVSHGYVIMGGIVGKATDDIDNMHIYDCVNYGNIAVKEKGHHCNVYMDGIVGYKSGSVDMKGCKNYGKVSNPSGPISTGAIVGYVFIGIAVVIIIVVIIVVVVVRMRNKKKSSYYSTIDTKLVA